MTVTIRSVRRLSPRSPYCEVVTGDGVEIRVRMETALDRGFKAGLELSDDGWQAILQADADRSCHDRALGLLARRPHARKELERKLKSREFSADCIGRVMLRLEAAGLIDDDSFARLLVEERTRRSPRSRRALERDLLSRGISQVIVSDVLSLRSDEDEVEAARVQARRWFDKNAGREREDRMTFARRLGTRGFGGWIASRLWQEEKRGHAED